MSDDQLETDIIDLLYAQQLYPPYGDVLDRIIQAVRDHDAACSAGEVAGLTDDQLAQAIADPGSIVGMRRPDETIPRMGVRAIRALQWTLSHPDTGETT